MSICEQLAQQLNLESTAPEQSPVGLLGLLANSKGKPEHTLLLGSVPEYEQEQSFGLLSLIVKGG